MRISTYGTMSAPTDSESITAWDASTPTEHTDESIERPFIKSILTPSIISLLVNSLTMCLASETLFSLFPLFAFTPIASGGLGMSEAAIGTHMAIRAVIHIGIGTIYAPLERYFGSALRFYRIIMCAWPLPILCAPMLNSMARRGEEGTWSFNCALLVFYFIWAGSGLAWTSTAIMVTEAAPSPGALATLHALSQMTIVLPEAIAPAFVTSLFAFSIQTGIAGGNLVWTVLFSLTCTAAFHSMTLREPKSGWRNKN
ncbi:hypothetical protein JB92DRAFT_350559 [Gautieria morchelliformis]|nr:hypothetical protein JB92DRAFT_350559 [Gautieria morchelliformis]